MNVEISRAHFEKKMTFLTIIYLCKSGFICNKRTLLYFILPKDCPVELFWIKDCDFQFTMLKQFRLFHFNLVISVWGVRWTILGQSVDKIIITIMLNFRISTSKNKKISFIKVILISDHTSLLHNSTKSSELNLSCLL